MMQPNLTIDYYQRHAGAYVSATRDLDMTEVYEVFLPYIPAGGVILDAGCGSGRDALAFLRRGYRVQAFDACPVCCAAATALTGLFVRQMAFADVTDRDRYNGIWACASLLHVPSAELPDAVGRLIRALRVGGHLYMSLKLGSGEKQSACGRHYTDLDADGLNTLLDAVPDAEFVHSWASMSVNPAAADTAWFNVILRRQ